MVLSMSYHPMVTEYCVISPEDQYIAYRLSECMIIMEKNCSVSPYSTDLEG